jgi:hypothetical protein
MISDDVHEGLENAKRQAVLVLVLVAIRRYDFKLADPAKPDTVWFSRWCTTVNLHNNKFRVLATQRPPSNK